MQTNPLADYATIIRRRILSILALTALGLAAGVAVSLHENPVFQATAQVLLNRQEQDIGASVSGSQAAVSQAYDNGLLSFTQAGIAATPAVAAATIAALHLRGESPGNLLAHVAVEGSAQTDLLTFDLTAATASSAVTRVNEYAYQYTLYRQRIDTGSITAAGAQIQASIKRLQQAARPNTSLIATLVAREQELATLATLQVGNSRVIATALSAGKIRPKPLENALVGVILGLIVGLGLALTRHAVDTRVRSSDEVTAALDLPLLGRVPAFSRASRVSDLVTVARPDSPAAEVFRILCTNLDFVDLDRAVQVMMVTSAMQGEGKTTVAGNLAVAEAQAGKTVALIDVDFRRPRIARFFGLDGSIGITSVAARHADLQEAVTRLVIGPAGVVKSDQAHEAGLGVIEVIPAGPVPPAPAEFVRSKAVASIVGAMRQRADIVILDTPPLLPVSDARQLSTLADGVLIVARLDLLRRPMVADLGRALDVLTTRRLGVVVTGGRESTQGYTYGYYAEGGRKNRRGRPLARKDSQ